MSKVIEKPHKIKLNKLLVSGSRSINDKKWIYHILDKYSFHILVVGTDETRVTKLSKEKYGVDEWAYTYAKEKHKRIISIIPNWEKKKSSAGVIRNTELLETLNEENDKGIVLWDGKSAGTYDMYQKLRLAKKVEGIFTYKTTTVDSWLIKKQPNS